MARAGDIKVNITCNVSCASFGHSFVKFDATRIYCTKCGEFRTAPSSFTWTTTPQWYPQWTNTTITSKSDCPSL